MVYNDMFWRIFEKSGNLDAYMGYIDAVSMSKQAKNDATKMNK